MQVIQRLGIQISPKVGIIGFGIVAAVAAGGVVIFPDYVPQGIAKSIVQTCSFVVFVVSAMAAGSHAFSSTVPGPLAPPDSLATAVSTAKDAAARDAVK